MVKSPCKGVCKTNLRVDLCIGCFRTTEEIAGWHEMTDEQRQGTLRLLRLRGSQYKGMQAGDVAPIGGV